MARRRDQGDLDTLAGVLGKRPGRTERFVFRVRENGEECKFLARQRMFVCDR